MIKAHGTRANSTFYTRWISSEFLDLKTTNLDSLIWRQSGFLFYICLTTFPQVGITGILLLLLFNWIFRIYKDISSSLLMFIDDHAVLNILPMDLGRCKECEHIAQLINYGRPCPMSLFRIPLRFVNFKW
jgi:hypothetical protein